MTIKEICNRVLLKDKFIHKLLLKGKNITFPGSTNYWNKRYEKNRNSGVGSYGEGADYKASVLNRFVAENKIQSVLELGCGDGNQAGLFDFPSYVGLDVSPIAVEKCRLIFKDDDTKAFGLYDDGRFGKEELKAELVLSLDVIYHLIEDEVYEKYMKRLFSAALKYVIIYAWDVEEGKKYHVRHRKFTKWITENIIDFQLVERVSKDSCCDFFIYMRRVEVAAERGRGLEGLAERV